MPLGQHHEIGRGDDRPAAEHARRHDAPGGEIGGARAERIGAVGEVTVPHHQVHPRRPRCQPAQHRRQEAARADIRHQLREGPARGSTLALRAKPGRRVASPSRTGSPRGRAAGVGSMPWRVRTQSGSPVSVRSRRSALLTNGCKRPSRSPAAETLRSLSSASRTRRSWRSIRFAFAALRAFFRSIHAHSQYRLAEGWSAARSGRRSGRERGAGQMP